MRPVAFTATILLSAIIGSEIGGLYTAHVYKETLSACSTALIRHTVSTMVLRTPVLPLEQGPLWVQERRIVEGSNR
jgi:hypothetical protein